MPNSYSWAYQRVYGLSLTAEDHVGNQLPLIPLFFYNLLNRSIVLAIAAS
jgi:hypothetical protein